MNKKTNMSLNVNKEKTQELSMSEETGMGFTLWFLRKLYLWAAPIVTLKKELICGQYL